MAYPVADRYSAVSGAGIYGGRTGPAPPSTGPAWATSAVLNKPMIISGSAGADGGTLQAWGSYAVRLDISELLTGPNGGHGDGYDNRISSLKLSDDAPVWRRREDPSLPEFFVPDTPHYLDGKPCSRHAYDNVHYVSQVNGLIYAGGRAAPGNGNFIPSIDRFDLTTDNWDAADTRTYPPVGNAAYGSVGIVVDHVRGHIWTNSLHRYDPVTNTYTAPITVKPVAVRNPSVYDPLRDQFFCLMWGDGQGGGAAGFAASKWPATGTTQVAITFNASAAYTQFLSEENYTQEISPFATKKSSFAGMTYDTENDCFYWYCGQGAAQAGHVYVITPNSTSVWDMSLFEFAAGSPVIPKAPVSGAGLNGRLKYLPGLKGFIVCPSGTGDIYFVRTS